MQPEKLTLPNIPELTFTIQHSIDDSPIILK